MSVSYRPVIWNRNKWVYDTVLLLFVVSYILLFIRFAPDLLDVKTGNTAIVRMRAFGTCAFLMLTFILCIGPLARLDKRFLPLLYNRRHFGVMTFLVAFGHFMHVEGWYYAFSPGVDSKTAVLFANTAFTSWYGFPFEVFGIIALITLFAMAATSHDFWLSFLTPPIWKRLHMGVYIAYGALVLHISFGLLQTESNLFYAIVTGVCFFTVAGLHLYTSGMEERGDAAVDDGAEWIPVGVVSSIPMDRARIVSLPGGERVAVFRYENKLSAISNVCAHQNGPLGEGRIIDGCVTCPWHGYQYRPQDGRSPAPFTEKVPTYRLRLNQDMVELDGKALPPGTFVEPVVVQTEVTVEAASGQESQA